MQMYKDLLYLIYFFWLSKTHSITKCLSDSEEIIVSLT